MQPIVSWQSIGVGLTERKGESMKFRDKEYQRATTPEKKREIVEALLKVWLQNPSLRLTQLMTNPYGERLPYYQEEDFDLIRLLEDYYGQPSD